MTSNIIIEDISRILSAPLPWERLKGKTVLITGAGGMIGGYCAKVAEKLARVVTLNRSEIYDSLPFLEADFVIHAASPASPRKFMADPIGTLESEYSRDRKHAKPRQTFSE